MKISNEIISKQLGLIDSTNLTQMVSTDVAEGKEKFEGFSIGLLLFSASISER